VLKLDKNGELFIKEPVDILPTNKFGGFWF